MLSVMWHAVKTHYNKASVLLKSFSARTTPYIFNVIPKRFSISIQQAGEIYCLKEDVHQIPVLWSKFFLKVSLKLSSLFVHDVTLQEEYRAEGISWRNIDYIDNTGCINLISKKPTALFHLLDEECKWVFMSPYQFDWFTPLEIQFSFAVVNYLIIQQVLSTGDEFKLAGVILQLKNRWFHYSLGSSWCLIPSSPCLLMLIFVLSLKY